MTFPQCINYTLNCEMCQAFLQIYSGYSVDIIAVFGYNKMKDVSKKRKNGEKYDRYSSRCV